MLYFTKSHEWLRVEGDTGVVGISGRAQELLGDLVFVELPEPGKTVEAGAQVAVVESVKAASEVYSPVSGEVTEVNARLADEPGLINSAAEGEGWMFKLRLADPAQVDALMSEEDYRKHAADA